MVYAQIRRKKAIAGCFAFDNFSLQLQRLTVSVAHNDKQLPSPRQANKPRCQAVADSKEQWGAPLPIGSYFFSKSRLFPCKKAYISLCAFPIIEDGADKLSSAPFCKIFGSPLMSGALAVTHTLMFKLRR